VPRRRRAPPPGAGGREARRWLGLCSCLPREADAGDLKPGVGVPEVAIARAHVARGREAGTAAQHALVDHELAVVLAERAVGRAVARVRLVRRARPLPRVAEELRVRTPP